MDSNSEATQGNTNKAQKTQKISTQTTKQIENKKEIQQVLHVRDLNGVNLDYLIKELGEPSSIYHAKAPVVSNATWDTDKYEIYTEFREDTKQLLGVVVTNKEIKCPNNKKITLDIVKNMLAYVNLPADWTTKFRKHSGNITEGEEYYQAKYVDEFETITVRCCDDGVYINPLPGNYREILKGY